MMCQLVLCWPAFVNCLFQSIHDKSGSGGATDTPPYYSASKDIDDEGHIHKPLPRRDIGAVVHPEYVWRWCVELAVYHCSMGTAWPYLGSLFWASYCE
mmetsp:Transcript_22617/g.36998  ORF Transcript_22617/g.36998 Transcript_22617/m.36998 type:complete len:98 (-) Transcript_22617:233-526(-)